MTVIEEAALPLYETVRLDGMRAVIAARMSESLRQTAQLTLHRTAPITSLLQLHVSLDAAARPTINALLLASIAKTLTMHRELNATLDGDMIRRWGVVNLGTAVAVEDGIAVPVIKDAAALSLPDLHTEAARLTELARRGRLRMADVEGGTFTVTNLGQHGIDFFTPIIVAPQVAILGLGRIREDTIGLSLTFDHRALDGVPAAAFLADLAQVLDDPQTFL